ncbi:hypothetical protein AKO1_010772 [Acrasis kona]|uniref:Uncharacterized protein n=1 Tax=Acrasis kona TaxID=1008807 RepID=A0AAW2YM25_9EUKA
MTDLVSSRTLNRLYKLLGHIRCREEIRYPQDIEVKKVASFEMVNPIELDNIEDLAIVSNGRCLYRDSDGDLACEFYTATPNGGFARLYPQNKLILN